MKLQSFAVIAAILSMTSNFMVMVEGQDEEVPQEESEMIHMEFKNRDHFI